MKSILISLLLCASVSPVFAGEVAFPYQRRFQLENYLTYFLTAVPLNQMNATSGNVVLLRGPLEINLTRLPPSIATEVQAALEKALRGEAPISGAFLDANAAQIFFVLKQPEAEETPPVQEEPHKPRLTEQEIRELPAPVPFSPPEIPFAGCPQLLGLDLDP